MPRAVSLWPHFQFFVVLRTVCVRSKENVLGHDKTILCFLLCIVWYIVVSSIHQY